MQILPLLFGLDDAASGVIIATAISALVGAASTAYSNYKNEHLVNKSNALQQSNFENAFQIQSKDMQKAGFNPAMLASGSAALASAPAVQTAQNQDIGANLAPLISAVTQAYLAPSQKQNIEADTKNKEGQFQHELDLQSNEFKHSLEVLGKTQKFEEDMAHLKQKYKLDEMQLQHTFNSALENLSAQNKQKLIKVQAIFDDALQENRYQNEKDLDRRRYLANKELQQIKNTHEYRLAMSTIRIQTDAQLEAAGISASVKRDTAYIDALSNLVDSLLLSSTGIDSAEIGYRGKIDAANIYVGN